MMKKKQMWMGGAIALVMAGCQSAQKNLDVALTEEQKQADEFIQKFTRDGTISSWLAYYEQDIRNGTIALSEFNAVDGRSIAFVVSPFLDLILKVNKSSDAVALKGFSTDAVGVINRTLQGPNWRPITKLGEKEMAEVQARISKNPKLEAQLTERIHSEVLSQARYRNLLDTADVAANKKALANFKSDIDQSLKQSKEGLLTVSSKSDPRRGADDVLKQIHRTETVLQDGKYINARREQVLNQFIDNDIRRLQEEVAKGARPKNEAAQIAEHLNVIRNTEREFMEVTGELPNYSRDTGRCITTDLESTQNYRQFSKYKLDDAKDAVRRQRQSNKSRVFCDRLRARGTKNFQELVTGRKGVARNLAGMEMSYPCPLTHTDEYPVFKALHEGKLKDADLESCSN